jgi:hypothetical protein
MESVLAIGLAALLVKLVVDEVSPQTGGVVSRKRVCDYSVQGSVFEDVSSALRRGLRLVELHVYSDEQDYPVVAKQSLNGGYDYAYDNWTFEECCVAIANDAFPSNDPLILSIVPHTNKNITLNRVADHLKTTVHRHLISGRDIATKPLDSFANKIILASGGPISGTDLETLTNISWNNSDLRRLGYSQAVFARDQPELVAFNRNAISMVAPDPAFGTAAVNPEVVRAYGCQWILFPDSSASAGFVEKPAGLQ